MSREIVKVDANSKAEAIDGLMLLLENIKDTDYDGRVIERVVVENEGHVDNRQR